MILKIIFIICMVKVDMYFQYSKRKDLIIKQMILSIYTDLLKYIRFVEIFLFINTKHHTVKIQMGEKF